MKSKKQIQKETFGDVYTLSEFSRLIDDNLVSSYDGIGYFHDGENETDFCVWNDSLTWEDVKNYPYVVWYNK